MSFVSISLLYLTLFETFKSRFDKNYIYIGPNKKVYPKKKKKIIINDNNNNCIEY